MKIAEHWLLPELDTDYIGRRNVPNTKCLKDEISLKRKYPGAI